MALKIDQILPASTAFDYGIKAGETILSINNHKIRDFLDLQYYSDEMQLRFELKGLDGKDRQVVVHRNPSKALGIEAEEYSFRKCHNNCVFCFIDQMPPGLRESLYQKDDDYIFSFVFGNYITLTNLSDDEIERIIEQRISPIYVSVHSTDPSLRQRMMRYRKPGFDLMKLLIRLAEAGIMLNFQIVCVPGYNDGDELDRSLRDLLDLGDMVQSIGVVPVGLTKCREGLTKLEPFTKENALDTLARIDQIRADKSADYLYAADELFVLAEREIPKASYYGDYPQIENGIGMLRLLKDRFRYKKTGFLKALRSRNKDYVMLCSKAASQVLGGICAALNERLEGQRVRLQVIANDFCGEHVSVGGLLTYSDFKAQVSMSDNELPIICDSIFNADGITLDGASIEEFKSLWQRSILVVSQFFEDWDWEEYIMKTGR